MMPSRILTRCMLEPAGVQPLFDGCEVIGTFNPAAIRFDDGVALLIRVAERPTTTRKGYLPLPYWDHQTQQFAIDWQRSEAVEVIDPRIVRLRATGNIRLTFLSRLLVAFSRDGLAIDSFGPTTFLPSHAYEAFGVEDPRLTKIRDRYYFTYVAVSKYGVVTALASTMNFLTFERHGIIFCPENKDVLLFPERIEGRYVAMHRPNPSAYFCRPEIWLAYSPDLLHWGGHKRLLGAETGWATNKVGGGTPPLRTEHGWFTLFHGNIESKVPGEVGHYAAGAMLLDLQEPGRIRGLSQAPVMRAEAPFEREGFLPNIVFPTACISHGDELDVYCGAADTATGVARFRLSDMMNAARATHPQDRLPGKKH